MPMTDKYRGFEISYNEFQSKFEINIDGNVVNAATLAQAKELIDNYIKEIIFGRIAVFRKSGWRGGSDKALVKAEITSVIGKERSGISVWVVDEYKKRNKKGVGSLYIDDEKNRAIAAEIAAKTAQVNALQGEIRGLFGELRSPVIDEKYLKD